MNHVLTGLYDNYETARQAVRDLESAGISRSEISIISNHPDSRGQTATTAAGQDAAIGAGVGALAGGAGGLLTGLGMLAIPGVGPVVAAGWLATALAGVIAGGAVGGAAGGLVGSLTGAGVPERDAHVYAEGVRRGGTLVSVRALDADLDVVASILARHGSIDPNIRGQDYRQNGWSRFDEYTGAYTDEEIVKEQARYR